jgi:hypothetical protein
LVAVYAYRMPIVSATSAGRSCPSISTVISEVTRTPLPETSSTLRMRCRSRIREPAHLVRAVVETAAPLGDLHQRRRHARDEGEGEIPVGNRLAARHLALRALHVDVNPLMVPGGISELVDHRLLHRHPVRRAQLSPHVLPQVLGVLDG